MNVLSSIGTVSFDGDDGTFYADSCIPLDKAVGAGEVTLSALARGHYPGVRMPEESLPGVRTVGDWDAQRAQTWGLDWHRNEGIEITYLARGSLGFSVDDATWDLRAGHVTVTRPWQRHRVGLPLIGPSRLHWIILDVGVRRPSQIWEWPDWIALSPQDIARLTILLQQNECAVWTAGEDFAQSFDRIGRLTRNQDAPSFESEMRIRISSLLLELLKTLESHQPALDESLTAPRRGVAVFLKDLDARLDHRWTVAAMASSCGMGKTQFARHCQELVNMSPLQFLTSRRLETAKKLLKTTETPVTDIAFACGFDSAQYFSTCFRRSFGVSPREFRRTDQPIVAA